MSTYVYNCLKYYCEWVLDKRVKNTTTYVEILDRVFDHSIKSCAKKHDVPKHALVEMELNYRAYRKILPILSEEERIFLRENIDFEKTLAKKELIAYNLNGRQYEYDQIEIVQILIDCAFLKYIYDSIEVKKLLEKRRLQNTTSNNRK